MKLLELVMIVKNSGEVFRECLKNNRKYIDHWTILDTGSTDNTIEIIQEELKDIPGNLYCEEFIDFATTRNRSLELSSKTCKYTIILDDSYEIHGGEKLLKLLKKSENECFAIQIGKYENNYFKDNYYSKRIIKSSKNLRYKFRVHEDIMSYSFKYIEEDDIFINDIEDFKQQKRSIKRYKNDIKLLLLDYKDCSYEPRTIYYLAKTFYMIEKFDESLKYYNQLKKIKNINSDFIYASMYDSSCIIFFKNNDIETFKNKLINISKIFKDRYEVLYKLAVIYDNKNQIIEADKIISKIISYEHLKYQTTITEKSILDYDIPYLYINIKLKLKQINEAVIVLKKLLILYPNNQPLLNIKYYLCDNLNISSIKLSNNKTIVFHCGGGKNSGITYAWNPNNDLTISGSEYMSINLAKEFYKLEYRVFIIGNFEDISKNINYQGIYDNIEYIDHKYFSEFTLKYVIDFLIISRFVNNLIFYDNIKKVYLWIHDILPILGNNYSNGIQYHKNKFKGIIAVSEWQKQNTVEKLNIPENDIIVSRNAIYNKRFIDKNIEKIPYRFIYSSSADRGLNYLIKVIPKIKEKYSETTLHLFVNQSLIDIETLQIINELDYVYLNPRVSQEQLSDEFLKSDIWLYPTDFQETYCITALEAMCAKCLVATVDYCGLGNVIKGRGIACNNPIEKNLDDLVEKLFFVMEKPSLKSHFIEKAYNWAVEQTYEKLAKEWIVNIFEK